MILESTVLMTILRYIIPIIGGIIGFLICIWWENLGKDEKTKRIKNWLVYAVTAAEKLYGPKMGVIKLQYVYEEFTAFTDDEESDYRRQQVSGWHYVAT